MEEQKRARVIYNPTSGQEIMRKKIGDVLNILESFGYESSAFQTTAEPKSAQREAERAALAGFDLVIAAGGDGTINEVVNGIAPLEKPPKLAVIPAGTTNDFARALKIPRGNPEAAAELIGKNQTIAMDVGRAYGQKYFINIAAAGSLTELTYSVPSRLKTMFGYMAYLAKGVELLPRIKNIPVKITHDLGVFDGKASMIFTTITNSVGGFEKIAPDAKLDDGKFTLIVVKTDNLLEIADLIRQLLDGGKHIDDARIEYIKTSRLQIEPMSNERMMINLDGEYGGDAPILLENLNNHITIFANTDAISDDALVADDKSELENYLQQFAHDVKDIEKWSGDDTR